MPKLKNSRWLPLLSALFIAACGGANPNQPLNAGAAVGGVVPLPGVGGSAPKNCDELLAQRVQPRLAFCRTCHVPGGVGDVEDGRDFMLSTNAGEDMAKLRAAWETLGRNSPTSRILLMASGQDPKKHTGGSPWPQGSAAYADMARLLDGFADPKACASAGSETPGGNPTTPEQALLGSSNAQHVWFSYCDGDGTAANPAKADSAPLPPEPRTFVQPGVDAGRAVMFNFHWKDCHADPELVSERPQPETCGEVRQRLAAGKLLMEGKGRLGAGTTFAGNEPNGYSAIPADQYNMLWQVWLNADGTPSFTSRPDNFDQLIAERYGFGLVDPESRYPLTGEDPNATNGGSGHLPIGFTQTRNADGTFSGNISTNCQGCHSTIVGTAADGEGLGQIIGAGGSLLDANTTSSDFRQFGSVSGIAIDRLGLAGRVRGTNNAQFSNILAATGANQPAHGEALSNGSTGTGDTPAWWNVGRRPIKFVDGMFPGDAVRVDMALFTPLLDKRPVPSPSAEVDAWVSAHAQDGDTYILATRSPKYPLPINTALAEQGAILFHAKDLWAANLQNPVRRPDGGNGSCASCHGAYSPRYINDTAFLARPELGGIASYITPLDIIGTDRVRSDTYDEATNQALSNTHVGYPETAGTENDCRVQNMDALRGSREKGYSAPPLFGVWATAPYFHNGSVPNVEEVLDQSQRKAIWRRLSKAPRADQAGKVVMGFDSSLQTGYDAQRLGWKYDALACGGGAMPYLDCNPSDPLVDAVYQQTAVPFFGNVLMAWNIANPPTLTNADVEERKIYNTAMFSQSNAGHAFSGVLTAAERRAIIEYLKTL